MLIWDKIKGSSFWCGLAQNYMVVVYGKLWFFACLSNSSSHNIFIFPHLASNYVLVESLRRW